jgi:UDP-3-O-[3-hydroxymyristoyl] glucosamine N-acyltransferase
MTGGRPLTAQAVADLVGGRLIGPGDVVVEAVATLERAGPANLSFLTSRRYAGAFRATRAGVVLLPEELAALPGEVRARILVPDAHRAITAVLTYLSPSPARSSGVHPTARLGTGVRLGDEVTIGAYAVLGAGVQLGDRVSIGPGAVLEDTVVAGDDCTIGPLVVCCAGTRLGRRVTIKAGAVLGGVGFGYISGRGGHTQIPHVGGCVVEDDVAIGSNSCIDRGSIDDTVVGEGTKIDNLVQLGHNVRVGRRCLLMAGVGVAGSTRLGDDVILAGQVGVTGHVSVGDRVRAAAQAGIAGDIPPDTEVSGFPARPNREFLRSQAVLYRLAPLLKDLEELARKRKAHA